MTAPRIPFNRAGIVGREFEYMREALESGHISGDGPFTRRCHALLEQLLAAPKVLLTTSCTHALEMSALLLDIGPGHEVIIPSFTFVSTANAFVLRGARPVFADIRADTLNIDESLVEALVTPRTRAIVAVHYAGVACEMDALEAVALRHNLAIIEDNAHGLFGTYRGRQLGTFGSLATLSFHETKNISCGEGGALVITDGSLVERAEIVREKGTDRSRFFRGQVDKYGWVDIGSSYLPSDLLAAFLLAQLEGRGHLQARRKVIWERYARELEDWASAVGARLPIVPDHVGQAHHLFYLLMPTLETRSRFIVHLGRYGILAVFHYLPLHASLMGRALAPGADCPITDSVSERLVRLPLYAGLTPDDQSRVLDAIRAFRP